MNPVEKPVFLEIKLVLIIAHNSIKSINYLLPLPRTRAVSLFRIQIRLPFPCLRTPLGPIPVCLDPGLSSRSLCSSNDEAAPNESLTTHPKQRQGP